MELDAAHLAALREAERRFTPRDFGSHFEVKALLRDSSPEARARLRTLVSRSFGLNTGGLSPDCKDRFFDILFDGAVVVRGRPDFAAILEELYRFPRRQGDRALLFSFTSKLVSARLESSPIYDRHVLAFFGERPPVAPSDKALRIEWFVGFLGRVKRSYVAWAREDRVRPILERFKNRDRRLAGAHIVRLLDFLVWKAGAEKLLER